MLLTHLVGTYVCLEDRGILNVPSSAPALQMLHLGCVLLPYFPNSLYCLYHLC